MCETHSHNPTCFIHFPNFKQDIPGNLEDNLIKDSSEKIIAGNLTVIHKTTMET